MWLLKPYVLLYFDPEINETIFKISHRIPRHASHFLVMYYTQYEYNTRNGKSELYVKHTHGVPHEMLKV